MQFCVPSSTGKHWRDHHGGPTDAWFKLCPMNASGTGHDEGGNSDQEKQGKEERKAP